MKKNQVIYAVVTILLFNTFGAAVAFAKVTDVPVDHWAYHAVNNAVTKGYLTVFEDGTFQGTRAVDRYALANVISRLLEEIEVARVKGTSGDLSIVRDLSLKFESDLARWYADQQSLRDELDLTNQNAKVADERLSRVVNNQVQLEEEIQELRVQIVTLQENVSEVQAGVRYLQTELGLSTGTITENETRLAELLNAVIQLEKEVSLQADAIYDLENWAGEKGAAFAILQQSDNKLSGEIAELSKLNQQLEKDLQNVAIMLARETQNRQDLAAQLDSTKAGLEKAQAEILVLREDKSIVEELKRQLGTDVNAQLNASLIREQRLERQIKELQEEFESYKVTTEKDVKGAKTLAAVAIALAAIGAVVGFVVK